MGKQCDRDEWVRLMLEIAAADRAEYRAIRERAWHAVVRSHQRKTPEQLATWRILAS